MFIKEVQVQRRLKGDQVGRNLGTGYYLSPWGVGRILGGSLDFKENKRGNQSQLRTQKGGSLKTLEGFRGGPLKFACKRKTWGMGDGGGGASRKSSKVIKRYHFSELIFKVGIG